MAEETAGDKTEAPSARRLEKAREDGDVPVSPELPALAVLAAAAGMLVLAAPSLGTLMVRRLGTMVEQAHVLEPTAALFAAAKLTALVTAPFLLAAIVASGLATLLQTGFLLNGKALMPDFARLSPVRGLGRVFGIAALGNAAKSVVKVGVVGFAGWMILDEALPTLEHAADWPAVALATHSTDLVLRVMIAMLIAQALISVADILFTRIRYIRRLRMSREDLRQEFKEMDGDPLVKGRMRQIRLQRARRRMMAQVPQATVVITNPTHYAVALAYARDSDAAPRIVAKGVDSMAARIREIAAENGVPIVANPPLARALYPHELERAIPAEFFQPVAEIIAYVWRLRGRPA